MAYSPEDKKKILDVRLNEKSSLNALRVAQQARINMDWKQPASDVEVSSWDAPEKAKEADTKKAPAVSPSPAAQRAVLLSDAASPSYEEAPAGEDASSADEYEEIDTNPRPRRIFDRFLNAVGGVIPKRGDSPLEIVRKCVFVVALITLIASVSYIVNDMVIVPVANIIENNKLQDLYDPNNPAPPPTEYTGTYPDGIQESFKALYAMNNDTRGWINFTSTGNSPWLNISLPVLYHGDNDYYLHYDFYQDKNSNGALFFDKSMDLSSAGSDNKVSIIYGHNMASGQMFARLNRFLENVNMARSAPVINLDTLYHSDQYEVFAVVLTNTKDSDGPVFDYLRTGFSDTKDFMDYVANVRARSLYDYNNVDVQPDDELLVLSTCTAKSNAKFDDGRCVIIARKVRSGESLAVNTSQIVNNDDAIMPLAWYKNQNKTPHPFYTDPNYVIPNLWDEVNNDNTDTDINTNNSTTPTLNGTSSGKTTKTTASAGASGTGDTSSSASSPTDGTNPSVSGDQPDTSYPGHDTTRTTGSPTSGTTSPSGETETTASSEPTAESTEPPADTTAPPTEPAETEPPAA